MGQGKYSREAVKFRWLKKGEAPIGMEAIRDLWQSNHILGRDEALFNWQYRHGKRPDELGFVLAEADGEIIGISGIILQRWLVRGNPYLGGTGAITIIRPEWRNSTAGLDLIEEADKDLAIVGSFGIPERISRLYKLQGRHIARFPRILAIAGQTAMRSYLDICGYDAKTMQIIEANCGQLQKTGLPAGWKVEKFSHKRLSEWQETWKRAFAPDFTGIARDAAYLAWRFLDHPTFKYEMLLARNGQNEIAGYAACRLVPLPGGLSALRITDFLALNEEAGQTLAAAIGKLAPDNCAYVEFYQLAGNFGALRKLCLSENCNNLVSVYTSPPEPAICDRITSLRVNIPGMKASELASIPGLHVTLADTDQDRPN